jgi:hypothetical protein
MDLSPEMQRAFWEGRQGRETREEKRDREQFAEIFWAVEWVECSKSLERFASHCKTKDEHAGNKGFNGNGESETDDIWQMLKKKEDETVRYFPLRSEKPHIWYVLDVLQKESLVCIEKSRQMQVTWALCLYVLWQCKFHPNRLWFIQSKKEEDSANLVYNKEPDVARISFIENHLPDELRSVDFTKQTSYGMIYFPNGSKVWGVPEGGGILRSYVASGIFSDEFAFQPEAEQAFSAALPTVKGGGQLIVCSTPWTGAFMQQLRQP